MRTLFLKRFALLTLLPAVFALVLVCPGKAAANAPKEIKISYDLSARTLQAEITHTPFSGFHYLKKVEVIKNGRVIAVQEYEGQAAEAIIYKGQVEAAPGDILEVKGTCSLFGSKTEKLTVGS